jgi:type I restriction enzyme M protein
MYLKGEPVEGEVAVITLEQAREADYNLSPSRWVGQNGTAEVGSIRDLLSELVRLDKQTHGLTESLAKLLAGVTDGTA